MELKPGYKQTEVGVIPGEWDTASMLELSQLIMDYRGRTPKKLGMDWGGGDIPALSAGNVKKGYIDFNEECYCGSLELYRRWMTRGDVAKDDILFTTEAPLGNVALVPDDRKYILSQRTILLRIDPQRASSTFLLQMMLSDAFQRILTDYSSGSTAKGIQRKKFEQLCVPAPPLPEQQSIATVLSDVDALLNGLERLIAKKRDLKQASIQQLLTGQTRLPGFSGEWEVKRLGECLCARPDYGINAPAVPYSDLLPTYIRITDITEDGRFNPDPRVSVQSTFSHKYFLNEGDVVFARTGASVGKSYRYCLDDGPLVFAGFLIRVRPNSDMLLPTYLAAYTTTKFYWSWVSLMSMRSGQPGINGNEYAQLPMRLPPLPEQTAIAAVLSDMDAELAALVARHEKTRLLKQGMMQELLTGKTRLV